MGIQNCESIIPSNKNISQNLQNYIYLTNINEDLLRMNIIN